MFVLLGTSTWEERRRNNGRGCGIALFASKRRNCAGFACWDRVLLSIGSYSVSVVQVSPDADEDEKAVVWAKGLEFL